MTTDRWPRHARAAVLCAGVVLAFHVLRQWWEAK